MRNLTWIVISILAAMTGGCTMGLGETTSFATRNLAISGELADDTFTIAGGTVDVIANDRDPELGVVIFFEAGDEAHTVEGSLDVQGNLGALCPGATVELEADGDRLVAVAVDGAPARALAPLMGLEIAMNTNTSASGAARQELVAQRLVMSSAEGEDGFSHMEFEGTTVIDGETRVITGSFEIARVVEDTDTPGWEGESWNGQPITNWE